MGPLNASGHGRGCPIVLLSAVGAGAALLGLVKRWKRRHGRGGAKEEASEHLNETSGATGNATEAEDPKPGHVVEESGPLSLPGNEAEERLQGNDARIQESEAADSLDGTASQICSVSEEKARKLEKVCSAGKPEQASCNVGAVQSGGTLVQSSSRKLGTTGVVPKDEDNAWKLHIREWDEEAGDREDGSMHLHRQLSSAEPEKGGSESVGSGNVGADMRADIETGVTETGLRQPMLVNGVKSVPSPLDGTAVNGETSIQPEETSSDDPQEALVKSSEKGQSASPFMGMRRGFLSAGENGTLPKAQSLQEHGSGKERVLKKSQSLGEGGRSAAESQVEGAHIVLAETEPGQAQSGEGPRPPVLQVKEPEEPKEIGFKQDGVQEPDATEAVSGVQLAGPLQNGDHSSSESTSSEAVTAIVPQKGHSVLEERYRTPKKEWPVSIEVDEERAESPERTPTSVLAFPGSPETPGRFLPPLKKIVTRGGSSRRGPLFGAAERGAAGTESVHMGGGLLPLPPRPQKGGAELGGRTQPGAPVGPRQGSNGAAKVDFTQTKESAQEGAQGKEGLGELVYEEKKVDKVGELLGDDEEGRQGDMHEVVSGAEEKRGLYREGSWSLSDTEEDAGSDASEGAVDLDLLSKILALQTAKTAPSESTGSTTSQEGVHDGDRLESGTEKESATSEEAPALTGPDSKPAAEHHPVSTNPEPDQGSNPAPQKTCEIVELSSEEQDGPLRKEGPGGPVQAAVAPTRVQSPVTLAGGPVGAAVAPAGGPGGATVAPAGGPVGEAVVPAGGPVDAAVALAALAACTWCGHSLADEEADDLGLCCMLALQKLHEEEKRLAGTGGKVGDVEHSKEGLGGNGAPVQGGSKTEAAQENGVVAKGDGARRGAKPKVARRLDLEPAVLKPSEETWWAAKVRTWLEGTNASD